MFKLKEIMMLNRQTMIHLVSFNIPMNAKESFVTKKLRLEGRREEQKGCFIHVQVEWG